VTTERESGRDVRWLPRPWLRRSLLTVGVVVTGWLLLGGSPAEAASAVPGDRIAALTAPSAAGSRQPSGIEIVEQATTRATNEVRERGQQRSHRLDQASTGRQNHRRFDDIVGGSVGAVVASPVELSGRATDVVRPDVTPCRRECLPAHALGALADTVQPVLEPVDEVTPATPGEPGVLSLKDREAPGFSVEAPRATTQPSTKASPESRVATVGSARPSSWSLPSTPSGGSTVGGSGSGAHVPGGTPDNKVGPALPHPVLPVPGPSHDAPDGTASTASGHGSVDRGQNVAPDVSPLAVAPRLVMSLPATSRSTGHPERATRPSVSPD